MGPFRASARARACPATAASRLPLDAPLRPLVPPEVLVDLLLGGPLLLGEVPPGGPGGPDLPPRVVRVVRHAHVVEVAALHRDLVWPAGPEPGLRAVGVAVLVHDLLAHVEAAAKLAVGAVHEGGPGVRGRALETPRRRVLVVRPGADRRGLPVPARVLIVDVVPRVPVGAVPVGLERLLGGRPATRGGQAQDEAERAEDEAGTRRAVR